MRCWKLGYQIYKIEINYYTPQKIPTLILFHFFKHSKLINTVAIIASTYLLLVLWSMHKKEQCIIIGDQISRVLSIAFIQTKPLRLRACLRINFTLQNFDNFRESLHETRNELKSVWDFKALWKVIPFTWQFHCVHCGQL